MAKKDEAEVQLEDEGTVTIDVSDNPELATTPEKEEAADDEQEEREAAPEPKKPIERKRLKEETPAVDEATEALEAARKKADEEARLRAAAEATAAAERARREAAEAQAQRHAQDADEARASAEKTQLTLLEQGIESAKTEVTNYEAQLATAYESGDFKAVASIQTKLSTAAAKVDRLEAQHEELANRKPALEGRVETPRAPVTSAFEQYVAQFAPEAQTWLRAHPECAPAQVGGQSSANSKMMAGHYSALAQNIAPNTPEYFRVIEEHTGHRQPTSAAANVKTAGADDDGEAAAAAAPAPKPKRPAQPSAPPSREPPRANGQPATQRTITLTKDEQDMAKLSFPGKSDREAFALYARNKLELQAEGKLGRTTH